MEQRRIISETQLANEWLDITIQRFKRKLKRLGIGKSNDLYNSFAGNVIANAPDDVRRIDLEMLFYGRLVDMGVGKGVSIADVKENARPLNRMRGAPRRKPKKWYSPTKTAEIKSLLELLAENYGVTSLNVIEKLSEKINIQL